MGVFREDKWSDRRGKKQGVTVRCPNCQEKIVLTELQNDAPVRCPKCYYPMICRADLVRIVDACREINSADQADSASGILERLSDIIPEAGTALGELAKNYTLRGGDKERWNKLIGAYSGGDERAKDLLDKMCQANPQIYGKRICRSCGALKYYSKSQTTMTRCIYCLSSD